MKLSKAAKIWIDYHRIHSKKIRYDPTGQLSNGLSASSVMDPIDQVTPEQIIAYYPLY